MDFHDFIRAHEHRQDQVGDAARAIAGLIDSANTRELENELAYEAVAGAHKGIQQLAELWQREKRRARTGAV